MLLSAPHRWLITNRYMVWKIYPPFAYKYNLRLRLTITHDLMRANAYTRCPSLRQREDDGEMKVGRLFPAHRDAAQQYTVVQ